MYFRHLKSLRKLSIDINNATIYTLLLGFKTIVLKRITTHVRHEYDREHGMFDIWDDDVAVTVNNVMAIALGVNEYLIN